MLEPLAWKLHVVRRDGCLLHGRESAILAEQYDPSTACELPLQGAHVVSQQALRKRGLHDHLWDVRNGIGLCYAAHRRHDLRVAPLPYELVPGRAHEFAAEHGLTHLIDRYFPKRDAA